MWVSNNNSCLSSFICSGTLVSSTDPPSVRCKNFTDTYGYEGAVFPCFYSKKNKTVVMTSYNRDTQVNTIIHFFVVPFIISIVASIGICAIHCNCSCRKERPKYRRPRIENIRHVLIRFFYEFALFLKFGVNFFLLFFFKRKLFSHRELFTNFLPCGIFSVYFFLPKSFDDTQGRMEFLIDIEPPMNRYPQLHRTRSRIYSYRPSIIAQKALLSKKPSISSRAVTIWEMNAHFNWCCVSYRGGHMKAICRKIVGNVAK